MSDINCPYCDAAQDINHDEGYGREEEVIHRQQCSGCDKYFTFTTSISFYYEVEKADCLNGAAHDFKPTTTYPKEYTKMECPACGETRKPSEDEMAEILRDTLPRKSAE